jgi:hypothetical protein
VNDLLELPRDWLTNAGLILKFSAAIARDVFNLRVLRFIGEALRQAGILIVSSTLVIWGLIFIIGLQCGIEGAYLLRAEGAPQYSGVFAAWCDLRELVPLVFGYMMAAKVGTGIVDELGSMRISDEIDALEVMGISGVTFLCATRLLASWLVLPFIYLGGVGWGFLSSYLAVVQEVGGGLLGRILADLLGVPESRGPAVQHHQGDDDDDDDDDGDRDRARGLLLRLQRVRRSRRRRNRHRQVDGGEHRLGALRPHARNPAVLGCQPESADRGLTTPRPGLTTP